MDKTSLSFLTNEWHNNAKDQVVLHAIYNLLSEPYAPVLKGITPNDISTSVCNFAFKVWRYKVSDRRHRHMFYVSTDANESLA